MLNTYIKNKKNNLELEHDKKEMILLANWLFNIKKFFEREGEESLILINDKEINNKIELFYEITLTTKVTITKKFDRYLPTTNFNVKRIINFLTLNFAK